MTSPPPPSGREGVRSRKSMNLGHAYIPLEGGVGVRGQKPIDLGPTCPRGEGIGVRGQKPIDLWPTHMYPRGEGKGFEAKSLWIGRS